MIQKKTVNVANKFTCGCKRLSCKAEEPGRQTKAKSSNRQDHTWYKNKLSKKNPKAMARESFK